MQELWQSLAAWAAPLLASMAGAAAALLLWKMVFAAIRKAVRATSSMAGDFFLPAAKGPARLMAGLSGAGIALAAMGPAAAPREILEHVFLLGWIGAGGWFAANMSAFLERLLVSRYDMGAADNLLARKIRTRYAVIQRTVIVVVSILALGAALMTFDSARHLGASILASAGVIGAVVGFSAQKTLGAIFAGIQIALTQPIRVDDVIVAEGEWGRVEEITFTYVVIRLWDQRRLTLPINYFLEKPFENWTRVNAEILGAVKIRVDYAVSVEAVRKELDRICREEAGELWDGRVCRLQVTEAGERTLELRALVSSSDSSKNWDLRCLVRETLIAHLLRDQPGCLPLTRARLEHDEVPRRT